METSVSTTFTNLSSILQSNISYLQGLETVFFQAITLLVLFQLKHVICEGIFHKHIFGWIKQYSNVFYHSVAHSLGTFIIVIGFCLYGGVSQGKSFMAAFFTSGFDFFATLVMNNARIFTGYQPLSPTEYHDLLVHEKKHGSFPEGDMDKRADNIYRWLLTGTLSLHQLVYYFIIFGILNLVHKIIL